MTDYFAGDVRSNRQRMLAGDYYIADDPVNAERAQRASRLSLAYWHAAAEDEPAARPILADLLGELGEAAFVKPPLFVDYGDHLFVGAGTFVNHNLTAVDVAEIRIGRDCQIGPNVQLLTATHPYDPAPRRAKLERADPIRIGDNVWIGGGAIILPGITIGADSIIGAGSVVTRDVEPGVIVAGNPARLLRRL